MTPDAGPQVPGPSVVTRRRWRTGLRWPLDIVGWSVFVVLGVVGVVAGAARDDTATTVVGVVVAVVSVVFVVRCACGLRPVRVEGDPPVLVVPVFSWRRGPVHERWPLAEIEAVEYPPSVPGYRVPARSLRVIRAGRGLLAESVSASRSWRHPERTRAGRAAAEIRSLVAWHRG